MSGSFIRAALGEPLASIDADGGGFSTFYYFATALAVGIAATLPFVPVAAIGRKFFILMSLIAVVFLALATAASSLAIHWLHAALAGLLIIYNISLPPQAGVDRSRRREELEGGPPRVQGRFSGVILLASAACGLAGVTADALSYPAALPFRGPQEPWLMASFLSSALVLGAGLTSMVLGHWYLVARGLSFAPLARLTRLFLAALAVRAGAACGSAWMQGDLWSRMAESSGATAFLIDPGMFVLFRGLFGIVTPFFLGVMAMRCIAIRSNQSATGILYVNLAFTLMGEIMAKHLLVSRGLVL